MRMDGNRWEWGRMTENGREWVGMTEREWNDGQKVDVRSRGNPPQRRVLNRGSETGRPRSLSRQSAAMNGAEQAAHFGTAFDK